MKPTVDMFWGDNLGLILPWTSGVIFTNQAGGYACNHPEAEGVFVPLDDGEGRPTRNGLARHFHGSWVSLTVKDADVIEQALKAGKLGFITVDRDKLGQSTEAGSG